VHTGPDPPLGGDGEKAGKIQSGATRVAPGARVDIELQGRGDLFQPPADGVAVHAERRHHLGQFRGEGLDGEVLRAREDGALRGTDVNPDPEAEVEAGEGAEELAGTEGVMGHECSFLPAQEVAGDRNPASRRERVKG
jgi:hypothetical protein